MNLFNRLPGHVPSPPGWEQRIWRRLPAVLLWGTLLPLLLAGLNHWLSLAAEAELLRRDFMLLGAVILLWTLALTVGLGCFIVRVMKGPGYVADAYHLPQAAEEGRSEQAG